MHFAADRRDNRRSFPQTVSPARSGHGRSEALLAGFLSPYLVGWLKQATAANDSGMYMLAAFMVLGAL